MKNEKKNEKTSLSSTNVSRSWKTSPYLLPARVIGSMFFAIVLILILAVFMAFATFWGMQFGDDASSWAVYHAGWFMSLCAFLGLSVLFSALLRFPWKKYQTGFLVTHLGILVLLLGCWVDFEYSQSGYLSIAEGETNSVAVCPGKVHFDLRISQPNVSASPADAPGIQTFRRTLDFKPGPFSWRFYGPDLMSWGVKETLPRLPWGLSKTFLYRNHPGDVLYSGSMNGSFCRVEVLDYLRAGDPNTPAPKPSAENAVSGQTPAWEPAAAEKFAWEAAHAGGNPGTDGKLSKMEMKQKLARWPAWVKMRITMDGEAQEFWLRQFDFFAPDGIEKNLPDEAQKTVFRWKTAKGSDVQLIFAQDTLDLNFALRLERFHNRLDPGTSMASHYSSDVTLLDKADPTKEIAKDLHVMMNQPIDLYEPGTGQVWRLFQTSFNGPHLNLKGKEGERDQFYVSTFTVHYSPGRGWIYLGCLLIVLGIGIMFSMKAYFFGRQEKSRSAEDQKEPQEPSMKKLLSILLAAALLAIPGTAFAQTAEPQTPAENLTSTEPKADWSARKDFDFRAWAQLPICRDGRLMPLDALARTHVRLICGKEAPRITMADGTRRKFQASEILFSWIVEPEIWNDVPFLPLGGTEVCRMLDLPVPDASGNGRTHISPREFSETFNSVSFQTRYGESLQELENAETALRSLREKGIRSGSEFARLTETRQVSLETKKKLETLENRYVTWLRLISSPVRNLTPEHDSALRDSAHIQYMGQPVTVSYLSQNLIFMFCGSYEPELSLRGAVLEKISAEELAEIREKLQIPDQPTRKFTSAELYAALREFPQLWKHVPFIYFANTEMRRVLGLPTAPEGEAPYIYAAPLEILTAIQEKQTAFQDALKNADQQTVQEMEHLEMALQVYCYWLDGKFLESVPLGQEFYTKFTELSDCWHGVLHHAMGPSQPLDVQLLTVMLQRAPATFQKMAMGWRNISPAVELNSALASGRISSEQWDFLLTCMEKDSPERTLFEALRRTAKAFDALRAALDRSVGPGTSEERIALISKKLAELRASADEILPSLDAWCRSARAKLPETLSETDAEWYSWLVVSRVSMRNFAACTAALQYSLFDEDQGICILPAVERTPLDRDRTESVQVFGKSFELHAQPWVSLNALRFGDLENGFAKNWPETARTEMLAIRETFQAMANAWKGNDPEKFRSASVQFAAQLRETAGVLDAARSQVLPPEELDEDALTSTLYPADDSKMKLETAYSRLRPFTWAWILPFAGMLILGASSVFELLLRKAEKEPDSEMSVSVFRRFGNLSFWMGLSLLSAGVLASTAGLTLRSMIMNRAPVTNMFETIVFVAWSAGVFGIALTFRTTFARMVSLGWASVKFTGKNELSSSAFRGTFWTLRILTAALLFWVLCFYGLGSGSGYTAIHLTPACAVGAAFPSLSAWIEWFSGILMLAAFLWWAPLFILAPVAGAFLCMKKDSWTDDDTVRLETQRSQRPFFAAAAALVVFVISYVSVSFPDVFKPDLRNLAPILRDNYWLAVHVVTIVASYGAGMLAWGLADGALLCYLFGRYRTMPDGERRPPEICSTLSELLYRCMQAAVLLLVVGTILGGLWADVSWGRFWSWDRKEVWALISLFVYLLILHARYVRLLGEFTLAIGAVLGAFAIIMAWYGVNYVMGSALHGYGAGTGSLFYGGLIAGLNFVLILAAVIRCSWMTRKR
ncbi:MAG: cytochrome c biogenesis protein CcsA [Thermoguttaceae bacterium]|nr:cytochrome c biogenesis protein CcsA [Thermoguttaceae bacterium]